MAPPDSPFSQRLGQHPSIVSFLQPKGLVLAHSDQLLVGERALGSSSVRTWLQNHGWTELTTLLANLKVHSALDVVVYEHAPFPHATPPTPPHVVAAVRALRKLLPAGQKSQISPNHVPIPASLGHSCPYGPPRPATSVPTLASRPKPTQPVTVIDSGYQWDPANWVANPLQAWVRNVIEDEWLRPGVGWQQGTPDVPGETIATPTGNRLAALAGHANFIAGLIVQHSPSADITIHNHNGLFEPTAQDFPTEASVARALIRSAGAPVVDLGYAFWVLDGVISVAWQIAFMLLGPGTIVVAPAGNQSSPYPRYPAALKTVDPNLFRNVVGVASKTPPIPPGTLGPGGLLPNPCFTNYGPWVTCSADGHDVTSTFLPVKMKLEDQLPVTAGAENFANGWAIWNGTSFAAPKVVAAITNALSTGAPSATAAWQAVQSTGAADPRNRLGVVLPF